MANETEVLQKSEVQATIDAYNAAKSDLEAASATLQQAVSNYNNMVSNLGIGGDLDPQNDEKAVSGKQVADFVAETEFDYPVTSVNGQVGDVVIEFNDERNIPAPYNLTASQGSGGGDIDASVTDYPITVDSYNWYLNGALKAQTANSHYTFTGLIEGEEYRVGCSVVVNGVESEICYGANKVYDTLGEGDETLSITNRSDYGYQSFFYSGTYNRTYFVFMGDRTDATQKNYIFYYDHDTKEFSSYEIATTSGSGEIHLHASLAIDNNGFIYCAVENSHNNTINIFKSDNPEDISAFTEVNNLNGSYAYPRMFVTESNRLIIVMRNGFHKLTTAYSDDQGATFTVNDLTEIFDSVGNMWMYAMTVYSRQSQGFHIIINYHANTEQAYPNLYHLYTKDGINWANGFHFQTNGVEGFSKDISSAAITKDEGDLHYIIINDESDKNNIHNCSCATLTEQGDILAVVMEGNKTSDPDLEKHTLYKYKNGVWKQHDLTSLITLTDFPRADGTRDCATEIAALTNDHFRIWVKDRRGDPNLAIPPEGEYDTFDSLDGGKTWFRSSYLFRDTGYGTRSEKGVIQGNYFEAPEIIFAWSVITNPGVSTDIYTDIIETVKVSVGAGSQPLGYSLQFTGDGYVSIGDVLDINNSSQTWECWFKLPDPGTADNIRLIDKRGQGGFGSAGISGMQLSFNNVGFGNTGIQAVSGDYVNTAGQSILSSDLYDNTWHHCALVWDNSTGTLTCYIDAVERFSFTNANMIGADCSNSLDLEFGRANTNDQYLTGYLDDVRIWNYARTQSQIQADKDSELTGNESGLIGYWKMNEGSGSTIDDSSSNSNVGTLVNAIFVQDTPIS
tara:strand:- start:147962 stop:150502 length:2541 start_codon:yes stop_codon:yes gene_type:complete